MPQANPRQLHRRRQRAAQANPLAQLAHSTAADPAHSASVPRPPIPRDVVCASCVKHDQDLIKACCCEGKWLHAKCFRQQQIETWNKYRSEFRMMPLTELLDCPHCGSAYRFKYQSRILRIIVERVPFLLWPPLLVIFYVVAYITLCETHYRLNDYAPKGLFFGLSDGHFRYIWGGVDMINLVCICLQVKDRGSLLYLAMWARCPSENLNTLTSALGTFFFVAVVGYNLYNITRDIYMYAVWVTIQFASPLCFMENCQTGGTSSGPAQGSPPAEEPIHPVGFDVALTDDDATPVTDDQLSPVSQVLEYGTVASRSPPPESSVLLRKGQPTDSNKLAKENTPANPHKHIVHSECICCLEQGARFVAGKCGHLVACGQCRKRLVYQELCCLGVAGLPKMRDLATDMVSDTEIACPICRARGVLVALRHFKGSVFHP